MKGLTNYPVVAGDTASVRYNPSTDMLQVYDGTDWIDWVVAGIVSTNFINTVSSDWDVQTTGSGSGPNSVTKLNDTTIEFKIGFNNDAANSTCKIYYKGKVGISNGKRLKMYGVQGASTASYALMQVFVSSDNFQQDSTKVYQRDTGSTSVYTVDVDYDLSAYAGQEISIMIYGSVSANGQYQVMDLTKFIIE